MLPFNPMTIIIVGVIAVLLFGERLPEMSKKIGKQLMELRRELDLDPERDPLGNLRYQVGDQLGRLIVLPFVLRHHD